MAKGNTCPSCGEQKFHKEGAVYECANCGAVGWWDKPEGPGGGKGATCQNCNGKTVRQIYSGDKFAIHYCSTCKATYVHEAE